MHSLAVEILTALAQSEVTTNPAATESEIPLWVTIATIASILGGFVVLLTQFGRNMRNKSRD